MAIAWPSYLPFALRDAYAVQPSDSVIRTELEGGPVRLRQVSAEGPETLQLKWFLLDDQQALFKSWFKLNASLGAALVDLPIRTFRNETTTQTVNFKTPITYELQAPNRWIASATVQVRAPRSYTALEYEAAAYFGGETNFRNFADPIDALTNQTIPPDMYGPYRNLVPVQRQLGLAADLNRNYLPANAANDYLRAT